MSRYVSWIMAPGVMIALIGAVAFVAAVGDDDQSTDVPLLVLVVGVVLVVVGLVGQAEIRRRDRNQAD